MSTVIDLKGMQRKRGLQVLQQRVEQLIVTNATAALDHDHVNFYGTGVTPDLAETTYELLASDTDYYKSFGLVERQVLQHTVFQSFRLQLRPNVATPIEFKQEVLLSDEVGRRQKISEIEKALDNLALVFLQQHSETAEQLSRALDTQAALYQQGFREKMEELYEQRQQPPYVQIRANLDILGLAHPLSVALPNMDWQENGYVIDPARSSYNIPIIGE